LLDLGKHAVYVLSAYGGSLILIGGLVWISAHRAARTKRDLEAAEVRKDG